jgi:hypothetical protein
MKCPHCGYDDKKPPLPSESTVGILEDGEHGVMYRTRDLMIRRDASFAVGSDSKAIYGCPAPDCGKTFIK